MMPMLAIWQADIVATYLREVGMTATIQIAVKRFRVKIVRAQTKIRRSLAGEWARWLGFRVQGLGFRV